MPLNPQVAALLEMFAGVPPVDYATVTPQDMRALNDRPIQMGPPPAVAHVRDLTLDLPGRTIAARLYVPEGASEAPPLVVYYHGGGWVVGTLETHDGTCRALARASGAAVLSVAYRLAPEARFPAPLDDCFEALVWAHAHAGELGVDGTRLAVAGDSAGGNLAAAVAIRARDEQGPALRHQLLIYPVTDTDFTRPSYQENGEAGGFLSTAAMRWFWGHYVDDLDTVHPHAAVLRHGDLTGLPPATVITAELDPLRDEGMAYAEALAAAGVAVEAEIAPGMIHGFFSLFEPVPDVLPYIARAGQRLQADLA
ncbi:chloramphenicol hydrolase [Novosphingobium aerophilum]|uniref:Chloramphenicol hydrolase n=1 Tax=Novosphingobium aerophilum TaxID=2839843 RepID=A0A7X1KAK4_9SPHN|nr:chloramphenicol hydrolase [Novosphingobium aerophilum]MBC2650240.1 chloramphenicol hydrolase [Novosphingobium aerophilum]